MTYSVTADGAAAITGTLGHVKRYVVSADGTAAGMVTLQNVPAVARPPPGPASTAPVPPAGTDVYTVTFNVTITKFPDPLTIGGASVAAYAPVAGTAGRLFAVDSNGGLYICFKRKASSPWNYTIGTIVAETPYALTIVQANYRSWLVYVNGRQRQQFGSLFAGRPDSFTPAPQDTGVNWLVAGNLLSYEPGTDSSRDRSAGVSVEHVRFWSGTRTTDQMYLDTRLVHLHDPDLLAWYDFTGSSPQVRVGPSDTSIQLSGNAASVGRGVPASNLFFRLYKGSYSVYTYANNNWPQSSAKIVIQPDGTVKYGGRVIVGATLNGT